MSSGQDIRAGRNTGAESTTALLADTTNDSPPVDFQGDYVLIVGSTGGDRQPFGRALTGIFGYGHGRNDGSQSGNGVVGAGGRFAGNGVVGLGSGVSDGVGGGAGLVGFGGTGAGSITAGVGVFGAGGSGGPATGTSPGVYGIAGGISDGVTGVTSAPNQSGVAGFNLSTAGKGVGVFGRADMAGIVGQGLGSGDGVSGTSTFGAGVSGTSANGIGVKAVSSTNFGVFANSTSGIGVWGFSRDLNGVVGVSTNNGGVFGASANTHGVVGDARNQPAGREAAGIFGVTKNTRAVSGIIDGSAGVSGVYPGAAAIYGEAAVNPADFSFVGRAGFFFGPVLMVGDLTVFGGKSAAVPHPDGSHRTLYAVESPESWFEDFGQGTLARGRAHVKIDPHFMALVHAGDYHVFLTPYGECNGLHVTGRTKDGFEVVESQGGQNNAGFSYRVVAKRKDIVGERLAPIQRPTKLSGPNSIPAPISRESMTTPTFNFSEEQLAQFGAGAAIPAPPKPTVPNLDRRHAHE
jgi:hypothetical protein